MPSKNKMAVRLCQELKVLEEEHWIFRMSPEPLNCVLLFRKNCLKAIRILPSSGFNRLNWRGGPFSLAHKIRSVFIFYVFFSVIHIYVFPFYFWCIPFHSFLNSYKFILFILHWPRPTSPSIIFSIIFQRFEECYPKNS